MELNWFNNVDTMIRLKESMNIVYWKKLNKLKKLYDVATAMYGAERTDLTFWGHNSWEHKKIRLVIHYPFITISNERNETHDIHNLYVTIDLNLNVEGYRTSLSQVECQSGYCHSHISRIEGGEFCKGQSPLALAVVDYKDIDKITIDDARRFIFALDVFLPHESIEGKPYKYMSKITENRNSVFEMIDCYITDEHLSIDFNYSINDNWIIVLNDSKLEHLWKNADFVFSIFKRSLTTLALKGRNISDSIVNNDIVYFKEQWLKISIIDIDTEYILPLFYQKIFIKEFQKKINEYIINTSRNQERTINA